MVLISTMVNNLYAFIYKNRYLIVYTIIGITSLLIETITRNLLIETLSQNISNIFALLSGILFAYYMNARLNFKVPKQRMLISMFYFTLVSIFSLMLQIAISNLISIDFIRGRFLLSGSLFMIAYFLHRKITFRDNQKIGIAIHLNNKNDIRKIYQKVKNYPDFIHIDLIDETYNETNISTDINKIEEIKKVWPNKKLQVHIMSKYPENWIEKIKHLNCEIYFHYENENRFNELMHEYRNFSIGPVVGLDTTEKDIRLIAEIASKIMVLCIENPGISGQSFDVRVAETIKTIAKETKGKNIQIVLDGGLTPEIVSKFDADEVVSASSILMSSNSVLKLIDFQTSKKYSV
jgi:pentose-5-phosphate-3-epimerase